jgi:hypothetical protein
MLLVLIFYILIFKANNNGHQPRKKSGSGASSTPAAAPTQAAPQTTTQAATTTATTTPKPVETTKTTKQPPSIVKSDDAGEKSRNETPAVAVTKPAPIKEKDSKTFFIVTGDQDSDSSSRPSSPSQDVGSIPPPWKSSSAVSHQFIRYFIS